MTKRTKQSKLHCGGCEMEVVVTGHRFCSLCEEQRENTERSEKGVQRPTPTPRTYEGQGLVNGPTHGTFAIFHDGDVIATAYTKEDAAFIVHAVNSHEALRSNLVRLSEILHAQKRSTYRPELGVIDAYLAEADKAIAQSEQGGN